MTSPRAECGLATKGQAVLGATEGLMLPFVMGLALKVPARTFSVTSARPLAAVIVAQAERVELDGEVCRARAFAVLIRSTLAARRVASDS